MDFKAVLSIIIKKFNEEHIDYALMGGFALGLLGVSRATVDLDFLLNRDSFLKVDKIMREIGYECVYKSEDVSQYVSDVRIFGEVDFLHAFRETSRQMLKRAIEKEIFEGSLKIKVLRTEDIIGLKLQAIANDERRTTREYLDIEALMEYYKLNLDWSLIEEYFTLFNQVEKFKELKKRFCDVK